MIKQLVLHSIHQEKEKRRCRLQEYAIKIIFISLHCNLLNILLNASVLPVLINYKNMNQWNTIVSVEEHFYTFTFYFFE